MARSLTICLEARRVTTALRQIEERRRMAAHTCVLQAPGHVCDVQCAGCRMQDKEASAATDMSETHLQVEEFSYLSWVVMREKT